MPRSPWIPVLTLCGALAVNCGALEIPAHDVRFGFEGRFDFATPAAPVVIWQDSRIAIDFEGPTLALQFADVTGQCFFNAAIDGHVTLVSLRGEVPPEGAQFSELGAGRHHLVLTKRSEASAGTVRFRGIKVSDGAQAWRADPPAGRRRMLFFGDSITAAACNEDGEVDQWEDRSTHNSTRGYAAMTAEAFGADHHNVAVSGMGIVAGWTEVKAGEIWDRVYPASSSPRADLQSWTPDVVFVYLGENDDSFTSARKQPFPSAAFTKSYVSLVRAMRKAWPGATIVALRGGMFGGSQSVRLREPWDAAIAQLEDEDHAVAHFVFTHWSRNHPRVVDDRALADELIAWLRDQPFMTGQR